MLTRIRALTLLALSLTALGLVALLWRAQRPDVVCPVPLDQLGLAADHADRAAIVARGLPRFQIFGAAQDEDNSKKNVRLWDNVIAVRGGHLPNVPQQIGDCVSFGTASAINYLQYSQMKRGPPAEFHAAFPPHLYGASRVTIGQQHGSHFRGDGSVGAYAAEAAQKIGVLPADHPQCPPYSGDVARTWGRTGPPQWALDAAKANKVQTIAPMESTDDVRDAICHGYPVTISSNWGTRTIRPQDGRNVARHDGSWGHCMCIVGYDGSASQPYWYVLNSWGPDAHPQPLQGEPPGGFWIDRKSLEYIVRSGDCWAFSAFDGFPAKELDLTPLRPKKARQDPAPKWRALQPPDSGIFARNPVAPRQRILGGSKA